MFGPRHRNKFPYRPKGLRRAVLVVLERRDRLNASELAGCVYAHGRPMARPGHRTPTAAQVVSVRRALRHLVASGQVVKSGRYRRSAYQRHRDTFSLATQERQ
jgi:hypothetical protein